ncbi:hypothetical protein ACFV6F_32245 [Kitasatospora phosalacinea]|uniref:hypothetical protein n=1 Tax=Kitasatospora phosalacinea TaxID=2065 RepID=UPI0036504F56
MPTILPGIAAFARGERPELPAENDGNTWVDGLCWLACGEWRRVTWVGRVTVAGADAPMLACESCIRRLNAFVWAYLHRIDTGEESPLHGDTPVLEAGPDAHSGRGRHRRPLLGLGRRRTTYPDGR